MRFESVLRQPGRAKPDLKARQEACKQKEKALPNQFHIRKAFFSKVAITLAPTLHRERNGLFIPTQTTLVQIAFGQVHSSKAADLGLRGQVDVSMDGPAVVMFCNGDLQSATAVPLPDEKKGRALIKVLGEYKGGGKCRQGARYLLVMSDIAIPAWNCLPVEFERW